MGGILNLWIGITFVTLVELGEFFYHVTVVLGYKAKIRNDKVQTLSQEQEEEKRRNNGIFVNNEKTEYGQLDKTLFPETKPT